MFNILIAEDDYELRHLFQRGLIQNGYRVRGVEDGKAALEALEKEYADLIISDIMMPVMDGYELVRALREAGNQTPVLMITAKDAFDDMRKGFLSGTDEYKMASSPGRGVQGGETVKKTGKGKWNYSLDFYFF